MKDLRICLLANAGSVHTKRWAQYLIERGHDVSIISFDQGDVPGARVYFLPRSIQNKPLGYLSTLRRARTLIAKIHPDVLHAHYAISYGVLGALCHFRPFVISAWGSDILVSPGSSKIKWAVLGWALRSADWITSLAEHITQTMLDHGVPKERIATLPFGVDTNVFYSPQDDEPRAVDVICTRNFDPIYDVATLLQAVAKVTSQRPTLKCVLAGDGASRESLRALAAELKIEQNVRWLGWIPSQQLANWLRVSEIYVSPSLSDGTSTALTEAMACGCYPVVSDIAANRTWVEDRENGFLFPVSDPDALADCILQALRSKDLRRDAATANRKLVDARANWQKIMASVEERYLDLTTEAKRKVPYGRARTAIAPRSSASNRMS